jgi:hypothetical protein
VDRPLRWCDNLSNNDPVVLTTVSKAFASVVFNLANDSTIATASLRQGTVFPAMRAPPPGNRALHAAASANSAPIR